MRKAAVSLALALVVLAALAVPSAARFGMPDPVEGNHRGALVEGIYVKIALVATAVFLLVFALLVFVLVRYREASGKGRATHEAERHNIKAEVLWTVIPLAIMLWIGFIAYQGLVELDAGDGEVGSADVTLDITGYQWAWEMDYGGGVTVLVTASPDSAGNVEYSDDFHVPADVPLQLNLTGGDVIHAFNILDANRAYFSMDDANPAGPHKVHRQVLAFPEGEYFVQCKEMCYNPGHAYMRARIIAEPQADYDFWLKGRQLAVGADFPKEMDLTVAGNQLAPLENQSVPVGTRFIATVQTGAEPVSFQFTGAPAVTIPPNTRDVVALDMPEAGNYTLTSGGNVVLSVVAKVPDKTVSVELVDYKLVPSSFEFDADLSYLIEATNNGQNPHNFYVGKYNADAPSQSVVLAATPTAGPGGTVIAVLDIPPADLPADGKLDIWCDVPGHFGLGMHGEAHVA